MAHKFPIKALPTCVLVDSGIGGLPYLQELKRLSPATPCIYIADSANFPYGAKAPSEIYLAVSEIVEKAIFRFHPSVIVLACNTMSVSVLQILREQFPLVPFVGTVPAIKKAAAISKTRVIGLLASGSTVRSSYTDDLIAEFASDCKVIERIGTKLIRSIERRLIFEDEAAQLEAVRPFVQGFIDKGADAVVLGCTHFLHLRPAFRKALGPDIQVVDSLDGVAQQALRLIQERVGEGAGEGKPKIPFDSERPEREAGDYFFLTKPPAGKSSRFYSNCQKAYSLEWGGLI